MKSLLKILAVSLMGFCQLAGGQNAANISQTPSTSSPCSAHPGVGDFEILSKTYGVDLSSYARDWWSITYVNWVGLMPKSAQWPTLAKGQVSIRLRILPDGKVKPRDVLVEVSSGDRTLEHAALKAIKKSKYPPLPQDFHEPYLEMRACFSYNMQSLEDSGPGDKAPKS
ncbi:MAG TPA: TonB family protein [Acidobacteriaceae bacterium]|nr:TonB family protein [Acidobacteriaceae bacterium]